MDFNRLIDLVNGSFVDEMFGMFSNLRNLGLVTLGLTGSVAGRSLYVANYGGEVVRLVLGEKGHASSFQLAARTTECGANPGWLALEKTAGLVYCLNEAYTIPNAGSVATLDANTLAVVANTTTDYGPAAGAFYAPHRLALAHYAGGGVAVLDTSNRSRALEAQRFHYAMAHAGPNATLQDKPYVHGVAADPTGRFVVAFDRGADALRSFRVGWDARLEELGAHLTEPGNGPRHGVFATGGRGGKTFLYVLGELTNSLHGFEVLYGGAGENGPSLSFRQFYNDSAFQTGFGDGSGVALPSEIALAEGNHLIVSVRNDIRSTYDGQESDTLVSYEIDLETGALRLIGLSASGGKWPRSFAVTRDGTMIAIGNQYSQPNRLVLFARDPKTGVIQDDKAIAEWTTNLTLPDGGGLSMLIWDE